MAADLWRQLLKIPLDEGSSYLFERAHLEQLFKLGLSEEVLDDAYFENYDPENNAGLPAWKKLMETIRSNKALHSRFKELNQSYEQSTE